MYTAVREDRATASSLYKILSPPFSQSWQLFTEIKDLLAYVGSSFSLKNTLSGPDESKWSRTLPFSLPLPAKFLTYRLRVPSSKHTQSYECTKFLSLINQPYHLHPISFLPLLYKNVAQTNAENIWHHSCFPWQYERDAKLPEPHTLQCHVFCFPCFLLRNDRNEIKINLNAPSK